MTWTHPFVEARVRQAKSIEADGATVLVAFPSEGYSAVLAAAYLTDAFSLRQVGVVECEAVPAVAIVEQGEIVAPIRLLASTKRKGLTRPLVIFLAEVPLAEESFRAVGAAILGWCIANRVETVVCMESVSTAGDPGEDASTRLWGISNHASFNTKLKKAGLPVATEGVIGGVTGAMLGQALEAPLVVVGLVETGRGPESGVRGATTLLEFLAKLLHLPLKLERLHRETERFEKHLRDVERHGPRGDQEPSNTRDFI